VVKHMPGHGRARVDSHYELPVVDASDAELEADIAPFRTLNWAPMGMTCHLMFTAWDAENPASLSKTIIEEVIRGRIGFDGLLMTDDIDMKALSGTAGEKAARAVAAGCDLVLDCWARMDEMEDITSRLGEMGAKSHERLDHAMATVAGGAERAEMAELVAKRDELLALV
jgi:beta-N-acetylhexosaminidase